MFSRYLLFSLLLLIRSATAQDALLKPGEPTEARFSATQLKHGYALSIVKDQYARLVITQRDVDVVVHLFGIDGKQIADFDYELRSKGEEVVEWIAEESGKYRLDVESKKDSGTYEIRFAELRAATERDRSLENARRLIRESDRLSEADKSEEAMRLMENALSIREKVLGPNDVQVAEILALLGKMHYDLTQIPEAELSFRRAIAIQEKGLNPNDPHLADSMVGLALAYYVGGKYSQVESLFSSAIAIKERAFGPDHLEVARSLIRLANIHYYSSDYVQAELLYQRCLTIFEKYLGENHALSARAIAGLANVYTELGDYAKAEPMFQRSLRIIEKSYGTDSDKLIQVLIAMGNLFQDKGDYANAEASYQRALRLTGIDDDASAAASTNLANTYSLQGEYAKAEPLYQEALAKYDKLYGPENRKSALNLVALADLYLAEGDYTRAESLYRRSLTTYETLLGTDHPDLVVPLKGMAILYWQKGDISESLIYQTRLNALIENSINYNLVVGSERQKLAYLSSLSEEVDRALSFLIQATPDNLDARRLAATALLQHKGRVLDVMTDTLGVLRLRSGAEDRALIEQLNDANTQLSNLVLNGPSSGSLNEHQQKIKALEEERERLENEISHRSALFYQIRSPLDLSTVQEAIPSDAALLEYGIYRPIGTNVAHGKRTFGEPRYVVFVFLQKDVQWKDLGEVKTIDSLVGNFRIALRDPKRTDVRSLARTLDEKIFRPVRSLLGDAAQLLISPEGQLNLIPFQALMDEQGRYLIERYACSYLTSGRDLLRLQVPRDSKTAPFVIANPSFGEPPLRAQVRPEIGNALKDRRSITTGAKLSDVYFAPLAGTAQEASAIKSLFEDATVLTGLHASVSSLKQMSAPRILHIATHGFFLADVASTPGNEVQSPLLRSGLALAGANLREAGDDDGILTALEAFGLNLWGTKLVTLSACDTGIGEIKNGEGVYGLRRAFVLAGAETLVMSLWPISDYVTRVMMTGYYEGLKQDLGRGEALRQIQLKMLKRKEWRHPFYWASFIPSGEWANLNGKR